MMMQHAWIMMEHLAAAPLGIMMEEHDEGS